MILACDDTKSSTAITASHGLVIVLIAAVFCLPCLISGVPPAGDSITHTVYQHDFSHQFWDGDHYPRWLTNANKGRGSPIFLIQYPLPYWLTALLRPVLRLEPSPSREARELGVFCFLAMAGAGLAARNWFRNWCSPFAASAGAIIYIVSPYVLATDLYRSVAIGQLVAFVWMPLALGICDSPRFTFSTISVLGIVQALLIMSNPITAFLFFPVLLAYAIGAGEHDRATLARRVVAVFLSLGTALAVAAVYVFPLLAYRKFFDIGAIPRLVPKYPVAISDNFLFVSRPGLSPALVVAIVGVIVIVAIVLISVWNRGGVSLGLAGAMLVLTLGMTMLVPGLGGKVIEASGFGAPVFDSGRFPDKMLATALSTLALGVFAYTKMSGASTQPRDRRLQILMAAACGAFVLMLPWSALAWRAIPSLSTSIQFPHRLCAILTVASAGLLAAALDRCIQNRTGYDRLRGITALCSLAVAMAVLGVLTWRTDQTWAQGLRKRSVYQLDARRQVDPMYLTYVSQDHLAPLATLLGAVPGSYQMESKPVDETTAVILPNEGEAQTMWQDPRTLRISYTVPRDSIAVVDLLYSPLWKCMAASDQRSAGCTSSSAQGLIEVPLAAGHHELELHFDGGWPERYGARTTVVAVFILLAASGYYTLFRKRRSSLVPIA